MIKAIFQANRNSSFNSAIFTLLAGSEKTPFLVHASVLQQSPVFQSMTQHPFKEKASQTIELPEALPIYVDCLVRFLYSGHYVSPKELKYHRLDQDAARADESSNSSYDCLENTHINAWETNAWEAEDNADDVFENAKDSDDLTASAGDDDDVDDVDDMDTEDLDGLSSRELEIGEDLVQMYIFGDMYQLPSLRTLTLKKLRDSINTYANPIGFFLLLSLLRSSVPESDKELDRWVQDEWPVASSQVVHKGDEGQEVFAEYMSRYGPPRPLGPQAVERTQEEVGPGGWDVINSGYASLYRRCASCSKPLDEDIIW